MGCLGSEASPAIGPSVWQINVGLLALGNVINALADEERLSKGKQVGNTSIYMQILYIYIYNSQRGAVALRLLD